MASPKLGFSVLSFLHLFFFPVQMYLFYSIAYNFLAMIDRHKPSSKPQCICLWKSYIKCNYIHMQKEKKVIDAKKKKSEALLCLHLLQIFPLSHTWFNWHCNRERTSDKNVLNNNKKKTTEKKEKTPANY